MPRLLKPVRPRACAPHKSSHCKEKPEHLSITTRVAPVQHNWRKVHTARKTPAEPEIETQLFLKREKVVAQTSEVAVDTVSGQTDLGLIWKAEAKGLGLTK